MPLAPYREQMFVKHCADTMSKVMDPPTMMTICGTATR